jgi:hypothetical protein
MSVSHELGAFSREDDRLSFLLCCLIFPDIPVYNWALYGTEYTGVGEYTGYNL